MDWLYPKSIRYKKYLDDFSRFQEEINRREELINNQIQQPFNKWLNLFYCNRCGLIYFPGEGKGFEPSQMINLLLSDN